MRVQLNSSPVTLRRSVPGLLLLVMMMAALASCSPAVQQGQPTSGVPVTAATKPAAVSPTMPAAAQAPADVKLKFSDNAEYGKYLVDAKGMSLYLFTKDTPGVSNCEGNCLVQWPPVLVAKDGKATIDGADQSLIGTTTRSDGTTQVTLNGWPVYYWFNDKAPGDTTGQGVGEVWYLINPQGKGIGMPGATSGNTATGSKPAASTEEVYLKVANDASLGKYLTDEKGMALYLYTKDTPGVSNCEGKCLENWPALTVKDGAKVEVKGMNEAALISTTKRSDGSMQVTYGGWPLYYWVKDTKPGDITGQGVGEVWYLVNPDGKGVGMPAASSGSTDDLYGSSSSAVSSSGSMDEVKLKISETSALGRFLTDEKGMTLYLFTKDTAGVSNCSGDCLVKWPPLLVAKGGKVEVDGKDEQGLVGTITRSDGSMQVTYKGMPLYYWVNDKAAGDTTGQGVGSVWYVVAP